MVIAKEQCLDVGQSKIPLLEDTNCPNVQTPTALFFFLIRRDKGDIHSIYGSCLSPERLALSSLLPFYSLDLLGGHLLSQYFPVYVFFSFRPSLTPFFTVS